MPLKSSRLKIANLEPKRKNPITLGDDSNVDTNLKPFKIDSKTTILELSDSELKIRGIVDASSIKVDGTSVSLNDLSDVTYSSGDLTIDSLDTIVASGNLVLDVGGDIVLNADGADITLKDNIVKIASFTQSLTGISIFYSVANESDYFKIDVAAEGATTLSTVDADGVVGHLYLQPDGHLVLDPVSQKVIINATDILYFDGGSNTYIYESSDDILRLVVGGDTMVQLSEKGADGNEVSFGESCVGFAQLEPTYDAVATYVDFRHSNKQFLTFGAGNISHLIFYFPLVSGNFQLLIKQDGTGSRTITGQYKVYEFDESIADGVATVVWAGGSAPTLTTDANHVDILSFYWDADNEIAYGVATLDFQF